MTVYKMAVLLAALVVAVSVAVSASHGSVRRTTVIIDYPQPDCPTEDSCTVDYRDGEWHIEEVTP